MSIKLEQKVYENILTNVNNLGFDIEYVEIVKEGVNNIVRIVIDKVNSSVSIDDCELVSHDIEDMVDKLITIEYVLEVSSPGLERQLKNIRLYKKYVNSEIYIKLFKKISLGKEITGKLVSVDDDKNIITILVNGNNIEVNLSDISSAHTTYDFDKALKNK
ncbi:MAG: ribosome maturation factor RimP [Clostridia bacterium]|nr:ribosome maturation factor RimP [Clostridia bacterium]